MLLGLSDNALLLTTCLGLYVSYRAVFNQLCHLRYETRTPNPPSSPKPRELDPNAEHKIDAESLYTLSKSPNYELRNAAIKILIDRAAQPQVRRLLLRDLRSLNSEKRQSAIEGLVYLFHGVDLDDSERQQKRRLGLGENKPTIQSLVTALINVQSEEYHHQRPKSGQPVQNNARWMGKMPPSPIRPLKRSQQESKLIRMLTYILGSYKSNPIDPIGVALQAGLVGKWLANYPFPCTLPEYSGRNFKKSDVVALFEASAYGTDDSLMAGLMALLTKDPRAMKELRNAGLTTSTFKEDVRPSCTRRMNWSTIDDMMIDVPMNVDEDPIGLDRFRAVDTGANGPRMRSVERSQEENRLRRRHREAIVVADRDEPLSRENILQRQDSDLGMLPMQADVLLGGGSSGGGNDSEGDDRQSQSSGSDSDGSLPSLEDITATAGSPVSRRHIESPHSFRQRVMERQGSWASFTQDGHGM